MEISVVIITFNEENNIARAIDSVAWADEVLVVDSDSQDKTRQIAEDKGARVVVNKWPGFSKQKQFGTDNASFDWILSLDADEQISEKLRDELLRLKSVPENDLAAGYKIPRLSYYMGKPIRHGGWYPDWQLRFFDRRNGTWKDLLIHESFQIKPAIPVGRLVGDINHFSIENASYHHRMIGERYAPLAAQQMLKDGKTTSAMKIATTGPITFFRTFFLKAGFLDGFAGFVIARFAAHHAFLKHLLLWELRKNEDSSPTKHV